MKIDHAVSLISHVSFKHNKPEKWADLGCGSGTFTEALSQILPAKSEIVAVDKSNQSFPYHFDNSIGISFLRADFERDVLPINALNGILMANSIHYVKSKAELIQRLLPLFDSIPKFLIVEYDTFSANPWVPFPLPFTELEKLFGVLGFTSIEKIGQRDSLYGEKMYSALIS